MNHKVRAERWGDEVHLLVSEEAVDINVMLRKAKNTKGNYQTINWDEQKGLEVLTKGWKWYNQRDTFSSTVQQCCLESATEMDAEQKL